MAALLYAGAVLVPPERSTTVVVVLAGISVLGLYVRAEHAFHLGLFLVCLAASTRLPLGMWPLPAVFGIACYLVLVLPFPRMRGGLAWAHLGRLNRDTSWLILASVLLAAGALVVWFEVLRPDVSDMLAQLPQVPLWQLVLVGLLFSVLNAAVEESIYRGMLLQALDAALGRGFGSILVQGAVFGLMHLHGFPRGWAGVALATIYGLMLGVLRRRAQGLLAPWIGHVAVDVAIVAILLFLA